jgi:hypothetical protein
MVKNNGLKPLNNKTQQAMKQLLTILIIALTASIAISQETDYNQFAIKSGYVEYELTGNTAGTKKFWWDNYGEKSRTEIKSTTTIIIFGISKTEEQHSISVTNGTDNYSWDLIKGTAFKTSNEEYEEISKEITEDMTEAEIEQMGQDIIDALGGERLGTEKFLGKKCEVLKVMMAKVWIYKGIPLKSEARMLGISSSEKAVELKENIIVPNQTFIPDLKIEFQVINEM